MRKENLTAIAAATVAVVLFILLLALAGSQAQVPIQLQKTATVERDGVRLTVQADKEEYDFGEVVQVEIFEKNLRNEPFMLFIGEINIEVLDSRGRIVWGPAASLLTWDTTVKIMPMEEARVWSFLWTQTDNNLGQVPEDTYTISMTLDGTPLELRIAVGN